MLKFTSENEGPEYFKVTLVVNEINLEMYGFDFQATSDMSTTGDISTTNEAPSRRRMQGDDTQNPYHFTWTMQKTEGTNEIKFAFKFDKPFRISKYAKDKIIV